MQFKKTYDNILAALVDFEAPCKKDECVNSCPFYPFQKVFDLSCAGFCVEYPKQAAKIMGLEISEENEGEE